MLVYAHLGHEIIHPDCPGCVASQEEEQKRHEQELRRRDQDQVREGFPRRSLMPRGLWKKTFENWLGEGLAYARAKEYAGNFRGRDYRSLMLYSKENGTGKTHLCAAIANRIFARWDGDPAPLPQCPVLYHTGPNLLLRVRATYHVRPEEGHETEQELYRSVAGVPLLILDDVGKEASRQASDHTQRVYFHIVDERYNAGLPILIASNRTLDEIEQFLGPIAGPAVVDRLTEMLRGKVIELRGPSYRKRMVAGD